MKKPDQYEIKTISDICKLPREQQKKCLVDLAAWMQWREDNAATIKAASEIGLVVPDYFIWVDDDKVGEISGITVEIGGMA